LSDVGFSASFSPDGSHIAFITVSGVFVMKADPGYSRYRDSGADGSNLTKILDQFEAGSLVWVP